MGLVAASGGRPPGAARIRLPSGLGEGVMNLVYLIGGIVAFALLVYLTYALLRPERFK